MSKTIALYYNNESKDCVFNFCFYLKENLFKFNKTFFFYENLETIDTSKSYDYMIRSIKVENYSDIQPIEFDKKFYFGVQNTPSDEIFFADMHSMEKWIIENYHWFATFLFVVSPSNSGSSFLKKALDSSKYIVSANKSESSLICQEYLDIVNESNNTFLFSELADKVRSLDFNKYREEFLRNLNLEKEILLIMDQNYRMILDKNVLNTFAIDLLDKAFFDKKYIFLIRNPYAICYGVNRFQKIRSEYNEGLDLPSLDLSWEKCAENVLKYFEYQYDNVRNYEGLLITYEEMTDRVFDTEMKIRTFLDIDDFTLSEIDGSVKDGMYGSEAQNYNDFAISLIPSEEMPKIKAIFETRKDIFDFFGYQL